MTTIDGQLAVVGGVRSTVTTRYAEQYLYIYARYLHCVDRTISTYIYISIYLCTISALYVYIPSTVTATGFRGEQGTEYLDDVEIFDGRRWKRAAYGLDQPRDGANLVKIPFSTFGSSAVLG